MQAFTTLPRVTLAIGRGGIATIPDARLQDLARYWFARRGDRAIPGRAAIDPLDFPALLPNIMLLDRVAAPAGARYRFRLAGTDIALYTGKEMTGRYLDEVLPPDYHAYVSLLNRTVLTERLPIYTSSLYHDDGNFVNGITYRLVMPLSSAADDRPDMIFVCQFWQRRADAGAWNGDWRSVAPEIRIIDAPAQDGP